MITKEYITQFCEYHDYPQAAKNDLLIAAEKLSKETCLCEKFGSLIAAYEKDTNALNEELLSELKEITKKSEADEYALNMIFYIMLTPHLKKRYEEQNITELFDDTVLDLKWKLFECFNLYGIWGTFDPIWFIRAFTLKLFGFGRLQFEIAKCPVTYKNENIEINEGDWALSTHIPSSGPLSIEECEKSFAKAEKFFTERFSKTSCLFFCYSWLLYPENPKYLPAKSNILKFMDLFKIVKMEYDPKNDDLWRIFYKKSYNDISELPLNTSMQRAVANWLESGNCLGYGIGLILLENGKKVQL